MSNRALSKSMFTVIGSIALATITSGCTAGVLVDENFNVLSGQAVSGAVITFVALDQNNAPTGDNYEFKLNNQPYISFDAWAPDGATSKEFPGLINSDQYIPPGNYYVEYFQPQTPFMDSNNFVHTYEGGCQDWFTGKQDKSCENYYFQLSFNCQSCPGENCPPAPPLTKNGATKVIQICQPTANFQ